MTVSVVDPDMGVPVPGKVAVMTVVPGLAAVATPWLGGPVTLLMLATVVVPEFQVTVVVSVAVLPSV